MYHLWADNQPARDDQEYDELCASMEELTGWKVQVKKARSVCLKLMQQAGIDTTDWQRINDFCRHPRIAGKEFAQLTLEELDSLQTKLRSIMRKGGLKPKQQPVEQKTSFICVPIDSTIEN